MSSDTYRFLARYFDQLFEFKRPFEAARRRILGPLLPGVRSACDLGCGTGTLAVQLARKGIRMIAVDSSPEMCRLARRKAAEAGVPVRVLRADMREFSIPEHVDLVTCEFDALNHVPAKRHLHRVLKCVGAALEPRGYFAFDVNNRLAFEHVWTLTWFVDKDPVALVMHGGHRRGTDRAWTDAEWFVRRGRSWTRYREHFEEVCWSASEIRGALAKAGFDKARSWDAAQFFNDALTRPGYRTFWLARKAG
jgi:SAM-dependent methyltransferase